MMATGINNLETMVRAIMNTRENEIGCADCFSVLDEFLELVLQGKNAAEIMPLVQDHLERCGDCHEEFDALLAALKAVS
jgi:non-canonical (house-cleaning) NTP pyrophosphatase